MAFKVNSIELKSFEQLFQNCEDDDMCFRSVEILTKLFVKSEFNCSLEGLRRSAITKHLITLAKHNDYETALKEMSLITHHIRDNENVTKTVVNHYLDKDIKTIISNKKEEYYPGTIHVVDYVRYV